MPIPDKLAIPHKMCKYQKTHKKPVQKTECNKLTSTKATHVCLTTKQYSTIFNKKKNYRKILLRLSETEMFENLKSICENIQKKLLLYKKQTANQRKSDVIFTLCFQFTRFSIILIIFLLFRQRKQLIVKTHSQDYLN